MATWEDGPEYAPVERPGTFAAPDRAPALSVAPSRATPSADAPAEQPRFDQRDDLRSLDSYHPPPGPDRDPSQPYAVQRSTVTEVDSAWSMVHGYHVHASDAGQWAPPTGPPVGHPDPRAPILLAGATPTLPPPPPGPVSATQPEWLPGGAPPAPTEPRVGFERVFQGVTVPTFVTLLIGGLAMAVPHFGFLSPLMFVLAFVTSSRIAYRRPWVRNTFLVASGALGMTIGAGFALASNDVLALAELVYAVSTAVCWLVLVALLLIVWQALAAGEQPEYPSRPDSGWG